MYMKMYMYKPHTQGRYGSPSLHLSHTCTHTHTHTQSHTRPRAHGTSWPQGLESLSPIINPSLSLSLSHTHTITYYHTHTHICNHTSTITLHTQQQQQLIGTCCYIPPGDFSPDSWRDDRLVGAREQGRGGEPSRLQVHLRAVFRAAAPCRRLRQDDQGGLCRSGGGRPSANATAGGGQRWPRNGGHEKHQRR